MTFLQLIVLSSSHASIIDTHPRIFINTDPAYYNNLDSVRLRVSKKPWVQEYERLHMWKNSFKDVPSGRKTANVLPGYALRWLLDNNDGEAADSAISMMMYLDRLDTQCWNLSVIAIAYDWMYHCPQFSPEQKMAVREKIAHWCEETTKMIPDFGDALNNHSWYQNRALYLGAIALAGEDSRSEKWLDFADKHWKVDLEPMVEMLGGVWHEGISYSTRASFQNMAMWLEALDSSTSGERNHFSRLRENGDWLETFTRFYAAHIMPNGHLVNYGDVPWYVVGGTWDNARMFMIVSHEYCNGLASWIIDDIQKRGLELDPWHIWYYLLWYDPSVEPVEPANVLDKSMHFSKDMFDLFFMRSGWDRDATMVTFNAGDWFGAHDHLDVGNFTIFKGAPLAIDAGVYAGMGGAHHTNFYNSTLSHNTILVIDPEEHFQTPTDSGIDIYNSGGQRVVVSLGGKSTQWSETADVWRANRLEGYHFERATIFNWESRPNVDYIRADITRAYNSDFFTGHGRKKTNRPKVDSVVRTLVYLKPDIVLVHDKVVSKDKTFKKVWNLNVARQPYLGEDGVFMALNGTAKLAGKTLLPVNSDREVWGSHKPRFQIDGYDMRPTDVDLAEYPVVPGGWMIRVSPTEQNLADEFLHVLVAGDNSMTAEEMLEGWEMIQSEGGSVISGLVDGEDYLFILPGDSKKVVIPESAHNAKGKLKFKVFEVMGDASVGLSQNGKQVWKSERIDSGFCEGFFDGTSGGKLTFEIK